MHKIIVPNSINSRYPGITCLAEARHHGKICHVLAESGNRVLIRAEDQGKHEHDFIPKAWLHEIVDAT